MHGRWTFAFATLEDVVTVDLGGDARVLYSVGNGRSRVSLFQQPESRTVAGATSSIERPPYPVVERRDGSAAPCWELPDQDDLMMDRPDHRFEWERQRRRFGFGKPPPAELAGWNLSQRPTDLWRRCSTHVAAEGRLGFLEVGEALLAGYLSNGTVIDVGISHMHLSISISIVNLRHTVKCADGGASTWPISLAVSRSRPTPVCQRGGT